MSSPAERPRLAFRDVVVGPAAVRSAFAETRLTRWWWAAILRLHGKPAAGHPSVEAAKRCVASGFRFYALLYGSLGTLTAVSAVAAMTLLGDEARYWGLLGVAVGLFLLAASRVAWAGARAYQERPARGVPTLMLFLGMVTAYLAFAMAVASVAADRAGLADAAVNVAVLAAMVLVGLGSYAVEMAYLLHVAAAAGPAADGFEPSAARSCSWSSTRVESRSSTPRRWP